MSSLAERLAQAEAEAAKKFAEEEATRISSEQVARQATQQADIEVQKRIQEAARQEQERVATLIANLSPLLDAVDARGQLEEVKGIWKVGTIDPVPQLVSKSPTPSVGLALRHRFIDIAYGYAPKRNVWNNDTFVGEEGGEQESSTLEYTELALFVLANQTKDIPTIQAYYGSRILKAAAFQESKGSRYYESGAREFQYLAQAKPEQFQMTDPAHAKALLGDQLVGLLLNTRQPLQWQEDARIAIAKDQFTSLPPAQSYYRSLMKSIRDVQPEASVPWYKRLLT